MPAIKKILFPVDFSKRSIGAARYVEAMAGRFEAEVMLLHVVSDGEHTLASELYGMRKAQLDAFLDDELKYYSVQKECVIGDAAEKIVEAARSWGPDLVMMPTYGLGHFRRLLLGSTTAKILHDLECPIWTDVHAEDAPDLENIVCRKILCAIGMDEQSNCLLGWSAYLAAEYQAELGIVHAVPAVEASAPARFLDQEFSAYLTAEARKRITGLLQTRGVKAATFIEAGEPATVAANVAKNFGADLLLIGRHAKGGLAGHLRQNAYAILRESPCPVVSI
jgi:nucleotide-binding universal stress UspA family protein